MLIPATLVLLLGAYDDLRGTNAVVKFVGLGLIATLFYAMGGRIDALSIPLFGSVQLPPLVSFVITVVWLVGITNAFNLIDGLDGLASGAALFSSLVILGVSVSQERTLTIVVALVLCGALAGFLRYNFNPASIFLGDSGCAVHRVFCSRRCRCWELRKRRQRSRSSCRFSRSVFRWLIRR